VCAWQAGASVNACDSKMRTPLSEAVEKGHMTIVEVLLKAGAVADHKVCYHHHHHCLSRQRQHIKIHKKA